MCIRMLSNPLFYTQSYKRHSEVECVYITLWTRVPSTWTLRGNLHSQTFRLASSCPWLLLSFSLRFYPRHNHDENVVFLTSWLLITVFPLPASYIWGSASSSWEPFVSLWTLRVPSCTNHPCRHLGTGPDATNSTRPSSVKVVASRTNMHTWSSSPLALNKAAKTTPSSSRCWEESGIPVL